jgi:beta-xylosidase
MKAQKKFQKAERFKWLLRLAAVVALIGAIFIAGAQEAIPPVTSTNAPARGPRQLAPRLGQHLPDMPLHDPWILAHEESKTYYLYTAGRSNVSGTNRSATVTYKSKNLREWDGPYVVFTVPDGIWASPTQGAWAPEVHRYNGKFYLFVTLHNSDRVIDRPDESTRVGDRPANVWVATHMRGTIIAVADSPEGPFVPMKMDSPVPPADFMTLDGTLYIEDGVPWMVYAHEWLQTIDGMMEAIPLKPDLSAAAGDPIHLFKASDAPWLNASIKPGKRQNSYVTDGPELYRTKTGQLLMLWSSYDRGSYVETVARSKSGKLAGPWEQLAPLVGDDSGHGMLFHTFDGQLMMVLHQPFRNARGKLFDMEDTGDNLKVLRARHDLDGS